MYEGPIVYENVKNKEYQDFDYSGNLNFYNLQCYVPVMYQKIIDIYFLS